MAMEFEVLDHPKLCFGEGPRWHDGSLHVVDMYGDERPCTRSRAKGWERSRRS